MYVCMDCRLGSIGLSPLVLNTAIMIIITNQSTEYFCDRSVYGPVTRSPRDLAVTLRALLASAWMRMRVILCFLPDRACSCKTMTLYQGIIISANYCMSVLIIVNPRPSDQQLVILFFAEWGASTHAALEILCLCLLVDPPLAEL